MIMSKKYKIPVLFFILTSSFILFYYFDPFEPFHDYKLPSGNNDFILCYYQADLGSKHKTYYIIDSEGNIKKIMSKFPLNYSKLSKWNNQCNSQIQSNKISDEMIKKIKRINPDNCRAVSHVEESEIAYPESCYYVVHINNDDISMKSIKTIYYNGSLEDYPILVSICRSRYTDDICDFIDEKVDEYENSILKSNT